ncbi:MAG: MBL fold metallo-hydrolase [Bryobacteraceae bacterium]
MTNFVCKACGTQFAESELPPDACPICWDDRQYIGWDGQEWTSAAALHLTHRTVVRQEAENLYGIGMEPKFAIGQRALLLQSPSGNILWDCISRVDPQALEEVSARGGVSAIAISHPHYYSSMIDWSRAFGGVPIYLHADDRQWVMRPSAEIVFWDGETREIRPGLTLVRCGGHFEGGTVLHWAQGGAVLGGDIVQVVPDRRYVSFMYSYPNYIPLNAAQVKRIAASLEPFAFDRIFGAWWLQNVTSDAKGALRRSVERYLRAIA